MPTYQYYCRNCDESKTLIHSMNDCDDPHEDIIKTITCACGRRMKRVPQQVSFNGFDLLDKDTRSQKFAERSKQDNIKNGAKEMSHEHSKSIRKQFE